MEDMSMKKRQSLCYSTITSASSALNIHKNSHTISKTTKPKIRIIHIFAPEIIKTDVANFRELVQRLTGKPAENCCEDKPERIDETIRTMEKVNKKDEQTMLQWQGENSSGFLGGLSEFDGFMQEFGEYNLLPFDSSHMQAF